MHNYSEKDRVAVVNRWCPWWLSTNDYAGKSRFNIVCRPLSKKEFFNLPKKLRPFMRHLCPHVVDEIHSSLLYKSKKAVDRTRWAYKLLKRKPYGLSKANKNIKLSSKTYS